MIHDFVEWWKTTLLISGLVAGIAGLTTWFVLTVSEAYFGGVG